MPAKRVPAALAAAVVSVGLSVSLAACAPPGQEGDPGVAATYGDTTVTNVDLGNIVGAWAEDTEGGDIANRRQALTIALLTDPLLAAADELGYPIHRTVAEEYAQQWIYLKGATGKPSEEVIQATQGVLALTVVIGADPTLQKLTEVSDAVEASAIVSPRSGVYSTAALLETVNDAITSAQQQDLGAFSFTEFQNVSAFVDEDRAWSSR